MNNKILLASSSPYRKLLLARLQIPFESYSPNIDETPLPGEDWKALVLRLSKTKAQVASRQYPKHVCIGSDAIATLPNLLLGKPGDNATARQQLKKMSGQKVYFYTGVCTYHATLQQEEARCVISAVQFRELTANMIDNYLRKENPLQSAGSFKSESLGPALIEHFEGEDPTALMGLPLIALCSMLDKIGIPIL